MNCVRALIVVGTRPEAIKLAPLLQACAARRDLSSTLCSTGQHREMLAQVVDYFGLRIDCDLALMRPNQTLAGLTARCLEALDEVVAREQPDCVVAQGDTTTVLAASVVAFYRKTPFVHVEAGLRTGNMQSPWPEEFNRRVASLTTAVHCAPTQGAANNLLREGIPAEHIQITGNTVVDALLWAVQRERRRNADWSAKYPQLGTSDVVLITGHRRENFGGGFERICTAIRALAGLFPHVQFVYPVHLNPNVQGPVNQLLGSLPNVHLLAPASYPEFVWLMDRCRLILTDSGGVQEEAPSLHKPVLVMRDTTERPEAVAAGAVELVGTEPAAIVQGVSLLLTNKAEYQRRQIDRNPYGDGHAAERIAAAIAGRCWEQTGIALKAA